LRYVQSGDPLRPMDLFTDLATGKQRKNDSRAVVGARLLTGLWGDEHAALVVHVPRANPEQAQLAGLSIAPPRALHVLALKLAELALHISKQSDRAGRYAARLLHKLAEASTEAEQDEDESPSSRDFFVDSEGPLTLQEYADAALRSIPIPPLQAGHNIALVTWIDNTPGIGIQASTANTDELIRVLAVAAIEVAQEYEDVIDSSPS